MRTCLFTFGLSLAATVMCVGSSFAQVNGGPPGVYRAFDPAIAGPAGQPWGVATQYVAPQYVAPQCAVPQYAGPPYAVPQYAAPQYGAPMYGGPQYAGPEYAGQQYDPAPSCGGLDSNGGCRPRWTFRADGVLIQRSTTRNQPLFRGNFGATAPELLNSKTGLNFPVEASPQVSAIRHGPNGWDIEVGYLQIDGWDANAFLPGISFMVTDVNGANFKVVDASARYISALYLGEINVRREWLDGLTLLAGFRMGELDERYQTVGTGGFFPVPVILTSTTVNHLYGFQLGADLKVFENGPLRVNGLCKAGAYQNFINRSSSQVDTGFGALPYEPISAAHTQTTFMGEVGIVVSYQFTKRLAARFVYQAAWLEGVALAPEQIPNNIDFDAGTGTGTVDGAGGLFYQGGGVGFELKF